MHRAAALLVLGAVAAAEGDPWARIAALAPESELAVRDREVLRADERYRQHFPEEEPFLLDEVRLALDRPLSLSARAVAAARASWQAPPAAAPTEPAALEGLEALVPEAADAVRRLAAAAIAADAAVREALSGADVETLARVVPRWIARSKPEDRERIARGEEDVEERDGMLAAAAAWRAADASAIRDAHDALLAAARAALPGLRAQESLETSIVVETPAGPVVLAGRKGEAPRDALVFVDFEGDDEHRWPEDAVRRPARVFVDLRGSDLYLATAPHAWGAALLGVSVHIDAEGDDDWRGGDWSLGCGLCGDATLLDLAGRDRYHGGLGTQGCGVFGSGALRDESGDDEYVAGCYAQGFASTGGRGSLVDLDGNDTYFAGRDDPDVWRRPATYITFAQGAAYGHRFGHLYTDDAGGQRWRITAQLPGGVGVLFDRKGDDRYEADVFGQGAGYWYGLGLLVDGAGDDRYRATWYGQGVGTHAAAGAVVDLSGDDWYRSLATSQGCGHDFSVGLLHDVSGSDEYSGQGLCQGAGNALSGLGILVDEAGADRYRCAGAAWGYGSRVERKPEHAPYGFLVDLDGPDAFTGGAEHDARGERGFLVDE